jgi:hypothetical protein
VSTHLPFFPNQQPEGMTFDISPIKKAMGLTHGLSISKQRPRAAPAACPGPLSIHHKFWKRRAVLFVKLKKPKVKKRICSLLLIIFFYIAFFARKVNGSLRINLFDISRVFI